MLIDSAKKRGYDGENRFSVQFFISPLFKFEVTDETRMI